MTIQLGETHLDEAGFGDVITARPNTSIDELGGFCESGMWAVSTTVWEASERSSRFASMLSTSGPADTVCPSRVIE
jgi:hypothetical protein